MDAMKLIELRQERAGITAQIRTLLDKYNDKVMDGSDADTMANLDKRFAELDIIVNREEKQLERERATGESKNPEPANAKGDDIMNAFRDHLRVGNAKTLDAYAAISQSSPTDGGYLIAPQKFVSSLIRDIADAVFMRQRCNVLEPLVGSPSLGVPTRTSAMTGGAWGTEVSAVPEGTNSQYGKREFKPNPHTVKLKESRKFVRNYPNSDALIRGDLAEYYSGVYETAYMTGSGAGQPLGVFIASADGIPTTRDVSTGNTATEIKFDGLIEAQYSIKQAYQVGCSWLFHRDALKQIRKLKNSDGQYIWQPSVVLGQPDMLLGRPVDMSEYAPNTFATGLYVGLYGNLKHYWIQDGMNMEIQVLNELYAEYNQIGYIASMETDGAPVQASAFARVKLG